MYRMVVPHGFFVLRQVEIVVHPDLAVTEELLLILAVSAQWLWNYFLMASSGGGG